jgi:carboxylate-amine ligase
LSVGVEEEFLLIDPVSRSVRPEGPQVAAAAAGELGHHVGTELTRYQLEGRTDPHTHLDEALAELRSMRAGVARARLPGRGCASPPAEYRSPDW